MIDSAPASQRAAIPTFAFAVALVRLGRRFLLVHERKHEQTWYFPAGRVEPGESFQAAAIRETREEAGIDIALEGIVQVEHRPLPDGRARMRVLFVARPTTDTPPKSVPDEHSLQARFFTLEEIQQIPLRGDEVLSTLKAIADGVAIAPLSFLAPFLTHTRVSA